MDYQKLRKISPYVVVLAAAAVLYMLTGNIGYTARLGQIGPDFWPKAILLFAIATCLYEIVRILFFAKTAAARKPAVHKIAEAQGSYTGLMLTGMGITLAYVVLVKFIGFVLATLLYLAAFMYIGRYRNVRVIASASLIGTFALALIFLKFVYISLPMGHGPFSTVTFFILRLLGIK